MNENPSFRLGLCMAGSVSAGAYTAGVLDALFEALEKWEEVRSGGLQKNIPQHRVVIEVFSGASGGGMCGVISGLALQDAGRYIGHHSSRLYHAWVDLNDNAKEDTFTQMLNNSDVKSGQAVRSFLNSSFIDHIADRSLDANDLKCREKGCRPWLSEQLDIVVTASNLRGLSYDVSFGGGRSLQKHTMTNHKLLLKFSTDEKYKPVKDTRPLKKGEEPRDVYPSDVQYVNFRDGFNVKRLKNAAKITGAFPFGLAPRHLELERELLDNIPFNKTEVVHLPDEKSCKKTLPTPNKPDWGDTDFREYETVCVDGGMTNNEPFEVTRQLLLQKGSPCDNMPREAEQADRAVIMIDPFPDNTVFDASYTKPHSLPDLAKQVLRVLMNQPLFKIEDIELAQQDDVFSRFLIIPTRHDAFEKRPIACGSLGGFGGFFKKSFREHDFRLGRYNCRRFLLYHFGLPEEVAETNPVFKGCWTEEAKKKWRYYDISRGKWMLPFVPVLDVSDDDNPDPAKDRNLAKIPYPTYSEQELRALRPLVWKRVTTVVKNILFTKTKNKTLIKKILLYGGISICVLLALPLVILVIIPGYFFMRTKIKNIITGLIRKSFREYGLMKVEKL